MPRPPPSAIVLWNDCGDWNTAAGRAFVLVRWLIFLFEICWAQNCVFDWRWISRQWPFFYRILKNGKERGPKITIFLIFFAFSLNCNTIFQCCFFGGFVLSHIFFEFSLFSVFLSVLIWFLRISVRKCKLRPNWHIIRLAWLLNIGNWAPFGGKTSLTSTWRASHLIRLMKWASMKDESSEGHLAANSVTVYGWKR